jgi:hypothetical protein
MGSTPPDTTVSGLPGRRLFALISPHWIPALLQLYSDVRQWLARDRGLYEFLLYDATLELRDVHGHTAILRKHQRVKFLQDHILAFEDVVWGDGDLFARYRVSPGVEADRYQEGDRWTVLVFDNLNPRQ